MELCYRDIIRDEFEYRKGLNYSYSSRAFAKDLGVSASHLSEVLSGKSKISLSKAHELLCPLHLKDTQAELFILLVKRENAKEKKLIEEQIELLKYNQEFKTITTQEFRELSSWKNYAFLSAMELSQYDGTLLFIAEHLKISELEVKRLAKVLLNRNFIKYEDGFFSSLGHMYKTINDIPEQGLRIFHKEHLNIAKSCLDSVNINERDITTMTMAINKSKIQEAKILIKNFRRSLCKLLEEGSRDEVYNLNIQLIPIKGNYEA